MTAKTMMSIACVTGLLAGAAVAQSVSEHKHDESYHADFIFGAPLEPSEAWAMSRGGRLYDNWYATQGLDGPEDTHPLWPSSNSKTGAVTTRCKSCHGWDYRGAEGKYASGSYKTGIAGVMGYDGSPGDLVALLRADAHGYSEDMIPDEQIGYLATFLAKGLIDMNAVIDFDSGEVNGDPAHGAAIFQTTCAACHGFDGRALDWGDADKPGFVGTEAAGNPWETLHKVRNGHPGVEMINLSAFPLTDAADLLAYLRTLPEK